MIAHLEEIQAQKTTHPWLRKVHICSISRDRNLLLKQVTNDLLDHFHLHDHEVQTKPNDNTDILLTSASFGEPLKWRKALLFSARRRFKLDHLPVIFTLLHARRDQFQSLLDHFQAALAKEPPDPVDFSFPGLAPSAHQVLIEQGRRGGPILAIERLAQAQSKSIHILFVIGTEEPEEAYLFNLVGAHPRFPFADNENFYRDIMFHILTTVSTHEVTNHEVMGKPIPYAQWERSTTVKAIRQVSLELGKRNFFTPMLRIADLVKVPAVGDAIASQYSEGCFASWDPELNALIATVTGSARPVDKGKISDDDLAVIVGVQPDGSGALVRHVDGKRNDPPSSEAVELIDMDRVLPRITLGPEWDDTSEVPVVRSKLHGHRGIASFDPRHVEHVFLDPAYYHFPVSCATEAQARAIKSAFGRSVALQNPEDPRGVVFTVLPGHGIIIVEKWIPGKLPFQVILEYFDAGFLEVENLIPQGPLAYIPDDEGRMKLTTP